MNSSPIRAPYLLLRNACKGFFFDGVDAPRVTNCITCDYLTHCTSSCGRSFRIWKVQIGISPFFYMFLSTQIPVVDRQDRQTVSAATSTEIGPTGHSFRALLRMRVVALLAFSFSIWRYFWFRPKMPFRLFVLDRIGSRRVVHFFFDKRCFFSCFSYESIIFTGFEIDVPLKVRDA